MEFIIDGKIIEGLNNNDANVICKVSKKKISKI
jgi:hypothetical protein